MSRRGKNHRCRPHKSPYFENRKELALSEVEGMGQAFSLSCSMLVRSSNITADLLSLSVLQRRTALTVSGIDPL